MRSDPTLSAPTAPTAPTPQAYEAAERSGSFTMAKTLSVVDGSKAEKDVELGKADGGEKIRTYPRIHPVVHAGQLQPVGRRASQRPTHAPTHSTPLTLLQNQLPREP